MTFVGTIPLAGVPLGSLESAAIGNVDSQRLKALKLFIAQKSHNSRLDTRA